jgi:hypothetical protein
MSFTFAKKLSVIICAFLFCSCQNKRSNNNSSEKLGSSDSSLSTINKIIDSTGFIEYWKDFRKVVLAFDTNKLGTLTSFPIQTRGTYDSDPNIEYSKKQFPRVFYFFLGQYSGDANGSAEFDIIKSTELPKEKVTHDQIRIGDMVFFLTDKKWKLNFLYLDYDTMDSIKAKK